MSITVGTDSYISTTDASAYFGSRLNSEGWEGATDAEKEKALKQATKKIDRQKLRGKKASDTQTLEFPRALYKHDPYGYDKEYIGNLAESVYESGWIRETEVAQCVKDAVCEEALALLNGIPKRIELQAQGVKSFSLGSLSETYTGGTVKLISQEAREFLAPYLAGSAVII